MLDIMDTYNHHDDAFHRYGKNENYNSHNSMMIDRLPKKVNKPAALLQDALAFPPADDIAEGVKQQVRTVVNSL